ncbi:MAG: hypothetical protein N2109_03520, partial [Fimbriimonadales bacterium]|nr:hypothetical protein [Fimbriimonadales bacterium]
MVPIWTQLALLLAALQAAGSAAEASDETLRVRSASQRYDLLERSVTYEGGVVAESLGLRLTTDRLVVWDGAGDSRVEAAGNVRVEDGPAEVLADRFAWDWRQRRGSAENVRVRVGKSLLTADRAEVRGDKWTLLGVTVTPCDAGPSPLVLRAAVAEVEEGRRARLRRVEARALGRRIASLPGYRLALVRGEAEIRLPRVAVTERGFVAASWDQTFPLRGDIGLDLGASVEDGRHPGYAARLGWSLVGGLPARPYSDLGNRFPYGYLDQLSVASPEEERELLGQRRGSLHLGSQWGLRPSGRLTNPTVNRPLEAIGELGGPVGSGAGFLQARLQRLEPLEGPGVSRLALQGALLAPPIGVAPRLSWIGRVDAGGYLGGSEMFWGQLQAGLLYRPASGVDLATVVVLGGHSGRPDYAFDRLFSTAAVHVRLDWRG